MFEKLKLTEKHFEEINEELCKPEIISDQNRYKSLMKELKNLTPVVEKYRQYKKEKENLEEAKEILSESGVDKELKEMAELEMESAKENIEKITEELKILLLPKDPNDDRNVIVEIRAGAGGEEAALFSGVLFRMYNMYAQSKRWKPRLDSAAGNRRQDDREISSGI